MNDYRRRLFDLALHIPRNVAMRYAFTDPELSADDLEQIGRMELMKAAEEWPGQGMFELYAWTRVRRATVDEIRRVMGTGEITGRALSRHLQVEAVIADIASATKKRLRLTATERADLEKLSCDDSRKHSAEDVMSAVAELSRQHQFVLVGRACGLYQHEIAVQMCVTESRVNQIERSARNRLLADDVQEAA